jgi:ferredoxin
MTYVVTGKCIGTLDQSCVEVCPVDCFYYNDKPEINGESQGLSDAEEGKRGMLMIHPDECINCGACETECPVEAIFEDSSVPSEDEAWVDANEKFSLALSDEDREKLNRSAA